MTVIPSQPSEQASLMLESLRQAVHEALERKQRLGQYAIVWESGELRRIGIGPDRPAPTITAQGDH